MLALAGASCVPFAGGPAQPQPPPPLRAEPAAADRTELARLSDARGRPPLPPPPGAGPTDEIVSSPAALDPALQERVAWWVEYWSRTAAGWFPGNLERRRWFAPAIDSAVAARDLPPSLGYLPLIESGYNPGAVSRAAAVGLWQLMEGTATERGLHVDALWDERRDPYGSTTVALDFLGELHERFGSWYLALAAYNAGPARVAGVLRRHAPLTPPHDSVYVKIRPHLPPETRDFVPKLLGAIEVASDPAAYGVEPADAPTRPGFEHEEVWVPDATTLDVVARAAGASEEEIHRLNPQVVRGITPPGRRVPLRVPVGRAEGFAAAYERIPPGDRVTFVEHRVRSGETLSHIAMRYRLPVRELRAANPGVRDRYLQIGQRLTVPIAPSPRTRVESGR